ncbi:Flp family type IVb pilin [Novosphingobium sp. FSY-8]|uniref:Flp family type IVb pilin n=1 Tax=Novosphingobium ovatum TaxID=1908523 RepID=A0ABW9XCD8_9SPHN|nr:Flp family type IVb pilin [Novosphingobium ovatum]NBC36209.1 Flp family type IVb pilin [Novosphingobium ovatum]
MTKIVLRNLWRDETGATAIEYGLIAALLGVALVTAMTGLGNQMKTTFNNTSSAMSGANAAA